MIRCVDEKRGALSRDVQSRDVLIPKFQPIPIPKLWCQPIPIRIPETWDQPIPIHEILGQPIPIPIPG